MRLWLKAERTDHTRRLWSLQYLRAVAALLVVVHHARNPKPGLYNPLSGVQIGQAGVDIFFIISGFVMYAVARNEPLAIFTRRRIWRVMPLYWIATLLVLVLHIEQHSLADMRFINHIIESLFFVPHYSYEYPQYIWPYLIPGWTLNYEIFFYVIFALAIALDLPFAFSTATLLIFVALGLLVEPKSAIWRTYTDPLLLEFVMGVTLARWPALTSQDWSWCLLPCGIAMLLASTVVTGPRVLLWGVPAALIVVGLVGIERCGGLRRLPWLKALGDASYSIYLFQFPSLWLVNAVASRSPKLWPVQFGERMFGSILVAALVGLVVHRLVDSPIQDRLRGRAKLGS